MRVRERCRGAACVRGRGGEIKGEGAGEAGNSLRSNEKKWNRVQASDIRYNKNPNRKLSKGQSA